MSDTPRAYKSKRRESTVFASSNNMKSSKIARGAQRRLMCYSVFKRPVKILQWQKGIDEEGVGYECSSSTN